MTEEKNSNKPPIAGRLEALLKRSGMNKSALARICGVTPQSVGKWFRTGSISKESAIKIAEAFDVSLAWLLGENAEDADKVVDSGYQPESLSDQQKELLQLFSRLPEKDKELHLAGLRETVEGYDNLFKELIKTRNIDEILQAKNKK